MSNESTSYANWALDCFRHRIIPLFATLAPKPAVGFDASIWLDVCSPGPTETTLHRLFPGSLFLLWVEALGGPEASAGAEPLATAIELLHNASLVHDDILDEHDIRKGQPTLRCRYGSAVALLGGDGLFASCLRILSCLPGDRLRGCLERLGQAAEDVVAGQLLDEPGRWVEVQTEQREEHWLSICHRKLALGNVPGPLAAIWIGRFDLEIPLQECMRDFSVVSQIINDFGDLLGFAGYHVPAPSLRTRAEESARKPTLPLIWEGTTSPFGWQVPKILIERARSEIARRKEHAIEMVSRLPLLPTARGLLLDFFQSPQLPV